MADRPNPPRGPAAPGTNPDEPAPPIGPLATAHPSHDLLLVAAFASDDLDGAARADAVALVAGCPECATLASDLRTLAAATRALPPARRPRDFTLGPADAARLRPHGLRRFLAALAAPRSLSRPLAASLTTLGVAGLLLASLPGIMPLGMSGAAPAPLQITGEERPDGAGDPQSNASQAPAASPVPAHAALSPAASDEPLPNATPAGDTSEGGAIDAFRARDSASPGPPILVVVSVGLLAAGLGLAALRRLGRRVT